jgi:hypothetical protein
MSIVRTPVLTRPVAAILGGCALLSVMVIMHHPFVRARRPQDALAAMARIATPDRAVHAILLVFILLMLCAFCVYAYVHRGRLLLGLGALAVFAIGTGAVVGAGLIDGFFMPAFAAQYGVLAPNLQNEAAPVLTAGAIAIQVLTKFAFFAFSGAALLWGIDLVERPGTARIAGAIACAAAITQIAIVASTGTLTPGNVSVIVLIQAVWCIVFAQRLWNVEH